VIFTGRSTASLIACFLLVGCTETEDPVRAIQAKRQDRLQSQSTVDHLGKTFDLLSNLVELNPKESRRQIVYHLNQWRLGRTSPADKAIIKTPLTPLIKNVEDLLRSDSKLDRPGKSSFIASDVDHLRDSYLCRQITRWVDHPGHDDPLLDDWFAKLPEKIGEESADKLRTAARLFDWTVRNIAIEPLVDPSPGPPMPKMSEGLEFRGGAYRQSDYQTLWRGTGDAWQQAGVFILLARQSAIPAFILALPPGASDETGSDETSPWCVGVLIGEAIYLFEPQLGCPVPGPGQVGIATLGEARKDPSVLRRLKVPGFFNYPYTSKKIKQCVALLHVTPEAISPRMKLLQSGLTGDRRMVTYVNTDQLEKDIDAIRGIAGVRLWRKSLLSEIYAADLERAAQRDPLFQFWYRSRWAILEAPMSSAELLAKARWKHLQGVFDNDDLENEKGARVLYLSQRAPEFEIADLSIDVNLQKIYGVRRELGIAPEVYQRQIQQAQQMMRMGKHTATYWISLIQYDDERYDTAETWFTKRVLGDGQSSRWEPSATYNLARTLEQLGRLDEAIELYKSDQNPRPHGSRIRARLLRKQVESAADATAQANEE
jgi:tetratricopeptide (TPR) repeat protein